MSIKDIFPLFLRFVLGSVSQVFLMLNIFVNVVFLNTRIDIHLKMYIQHTQIYLLIYLWIYVATQLVKMQLWVVYSKNNTISSAMKHTKSTEITNKKSRHITISSTSQFI